MGCRTAVQTVTRLWECFQARDWAAARTLLHDDATMHWLSSSEHFDDADAIIQVQRIYPEGWTIRVLEVDELINGDVHSVVGVSHPPMRFIAHSRFQLQAGRIRCIAESWATVEEPPAWRNAAAIGAYRRDVTEPDT